MRAFRVATTSRLAASLARVVATPSVRSCATATAAAANTRMQAAAAAGIPASAASAASQAYLTWEEIRLTSNAAQSLVATCGSTNFSKIRSDNVALKGSTKPVTGTLAAALKKAKTLDEVAAAVEGTLLPVRKLEKERYDLQLYIWGRNDLINLGLNVSSPEQVETYKKEKSVAEKQLAENRAKLSEYSKKTFDTTSFNFIINAFRVAGGAHPNAKAYAEFLLDDMTLAEVPFDEVTKLLLKNVVFGDQPHEDSNMLFTFVENPERGEVSLAPLQKGDLSPVADEAIFTIGRRHTTPVTEHTKLQQADTHPMLQRSPE